MSRHFSKVAIFHFWKPERVNIAGFELPQQFSLSEEFISHFWRISSLIGSADTAQKVYRFIIQFALFTIKYFYIKVHYKDGKSKLSDTNNNQ